MNKLQRRLIFTALTVSSVLWSTVSSAAIYAKIEGIKGDVTAKGFEDWIEIESFSWGIARQTDLSFGSANREFGQPMTTEVSLTKQLDSSSTRLAMEALMGEAQRTEIEFTQVGESGPTAFLKLVLCDAYVTALSTSGSSDGRPYEDLTLVFAAFKLEYISPDPSQQNNPHKATWDFTTGDAGGCS